MTLVEIIVVIAIMGLVAAVAVPSFQAIFDVQQRGAARDLATTYRYLQAEAALRNVSFRVVYNLDANSYKVEVGDPNALLFGDPQRMAEWEKEQQEKLKRFQKKGKSDETETEAAADGNYTQLTMDGFESDVELPTNTGFGWIYTPEYSEPQRPSEEPPEDASEQHLVYSHVFPNGFVEYTAVRIIDSNNPEDGYTVVVQPLSGETSVETDDIDPIKAMDWLPEEAPTIQ